MGGGKGRVVYANQFANDPDHNIVYAKSKTWVLLQGAALFAALASSQAQCFDFGTKQ